LGVGAAIVLGGRGHPKAFDIWLVSHHGNTLHWFVEVTGGRRRSCRNLAATTQHAEGELRCEFPAPKRPQEPGSRNPAPTELCDHRASTCRATPEQRAQPELRSE